MTIPATRNSKHIYWSCELKCSYFVAESSNEAIITTVPSSISFRNLIKGATSMQSDTRLTNCMNWICKCLQKKKKKKRFKYTHLQPTYQNILFWQLPLSSLWKNKQTKIQFFRIRFVTLGIKSGVLEWIMSPLTRAMLIPLPTLFFTPLITLQPIIWKGENIWIHLNIQAYKLKEMGDL